MAPTSVQQRLAAESLYRDANSLLYADNKPSDDAIDRVVGKINAECVLYSVFICNVANMRYSVDKKKKFSRKRNNEDEGDITYINERNRVFNKKVRVCYCSIPSPHSLLPIPRSLYPALGFILSLSLFLFSFMLSVISATRR